MDWPIFVISLKDATERREKLLQQCAAHSIDVEILDAIDGRHGLPVEMEHKVDRDAAFSRLGRKMTDGEFACALSHQMVYERILRDDLPGAIVLEDDALISTEFATFIHSQKYKVADFIQVDYNNARYYRWPCPKFFAQVKLARVVQNAHLTSGYSLSNQAAQYMLLHSRPLAGCADWPCDLQPLKPKITLPRLITQPPINPANSVLHEERKLMLEAVSRKPRSGRWKRFGRASYWRRWIIKRASRETGLYLYLPPK